MAQLQDSFGRHFAYLRLSVTEACNFRCVYCLPNGYKRSSDESFLSRDEIKNLAVAFAELGTKKIRLTGGEPTLRQDILEIASDLKYVAGIERIALSTNAFRLKELANKLRPAGIDAINISMDTLDADRFQEITGSPRLPKILDGIDACLDAGFPLVKINAVLMKDWNSDQLNTFLEWVKARPVVVRFIELMRTGDNQNLFDRRHVSADGLRRLLFESGWEALERGEVDGPAQEFQHPEFKGRMGIIAPYAKNFCSNCNRLRVTARGGLRLCLFGEENLPLRDLLQHSDQKDELKVRLQNLLQRKQVSHYLPDGKFGNNFGFSAIGG